MLSQEPEEHCRAEGRPAQSQSGRPPVRGRWAERRSGWERSVPFSSALDCRLESVRRTLRSSSQHSLWTPRSTCSAGSRHHLRRRSRWGRLWLWRWVETPPTPPRLTPRDSKCAHGSQSRQSYHSDNHEEMIPPARGRGIIVILISFIGFASLGRLNGVAVAVIGRGRGSPGARKKSIR